ncbi:hypothetical protein [Amphritea pacifica]|uniref:hypothetical protein n=1 Tax=Amphritea pacifica TaxID=2811233 RepID=UPI0019641BB0|nr:hypothetical protein [Amphritea pacifica]MBN1005117.1 hypothetical protein [Amphritea pacifica]
MLRSTIIASGLLLFVSPLIPAQLTAEELLVGKTCPVTFQNQAVGILVFSRAWYHSSRSNAAYIPGDNATGVGLEIHFFSNDAGDTEQLNLPNCDRYRILQVRHSNTRMVPGEHSSQIDVPEQFLAPFYDNDPLEYGRGVHQVPADDHDKPWHGRPVRASTVAIYDTPFVSDFWGTEGENIDVRFETCVVCQRDLHYDALLSCGQWGYQRSYMGGMTGWAEPEFQPVQCLPQPTERFKTTLNNSNRIEYNYWLHWR